MNTSAVRRELVTLATALMFLTRLPVGKYGSGDMQVLVKSVRYFPLAGFLVALLMSAVLAVVMLVLPLSVAVVFSLVAGILATGAFHEDGLADVADSAGAFNLDRKLEIMRDSRVGTYGALGLLLVILLRFSLLLELAQVSMATTVGALIFAHGSSRWSSAYLMAFVDYARAEAANKVVAEGVTAPVLLHATLCLLVVLLLPAVLLSPWVYPGLVIAWLTTVACAFWFKKVFTGITGDCLGAANVLVELACLSVVVALVV